ncbi:xylulokinase [Colidextribacter sp. OB.20]|uniref:xylulokinase n=1 Tax=Colidextribacter sp. OB.20 TaxID=2304568 RepID=UPI00136FF284|nr:xylulokinase [Colidextribacter sp. OB.20]NBI08974.1 xylulokinase [Colidextribacter sp. OB.20]
MSCFLGIDSGTSGVKALILDEEGAVQGIGYQECNVINPEPGFAEQDPMDWWRACCGAVKEAVSKSGRGQDIIGIGFSGQMQGNVMLDKDLKPIGNCMIWLDQRATAEVEDIARIITADQSLSITTNHCLNSFWAPKLLWLKKHRPQEFEQTHKVVFTKDFLRLLMTGELSTEVSDASLTYLMDVPGRCWSETMLKSLGIPKEIMPERLTESQEVCGYLLESVAKDWGLKAGIPVVSGAGDQPACGVGTGIVRSGVVGSSIGTSGVIFASADQPFVIEKQCATYSMCHAVPGLWGFLGLTLTSGASFKWVRDTFFPEKKAELAAQGKDIYDYMTGLAEQAAVGSEGLAFLPYLNGEKTPINDENARGVFFGLSQRHGLNEICRSVMEGVTFSLRDSVELFREHGLEVREIRASGGGAKSQLWRQMQADIYNAKVVTMNMEEGPAAGAAILAGVGAGFYKNVAEGCDAVLKIESVTEPIPEHVSIYNDYYQTYRQLYVSLKETFAAQAAIVRRYVR